MLTEAQNPKGQGLLPLHNTYPELDDENHCEARTDQVAAIAGWNPVNESRTKARNHFGGGAQSTETDVVPLLHRRKTHEPQGSDNPGANITFISNFV